MRKTWQHTLSGAWRYLARWRAVKRVRIATSTFEPDARVGLFEFVRLQRFLGDILGCPVDLVTPDALRAEMREQILREAVYAT
jgi:hypothetical protein